MRVLGDSPLELRFLQGELIMRLKRSTIKSLADQRLMIQSEVMVKPHSNRAKYPTPSCRVKERRRRSACWRTRTKGKQREKNAYSSIRQNNIPGTWGILLHQLRLPISQEHQQVRDEHVELSLCFGRPLSFREIKDIADSPDRGMRFQLKRRLHPHETRG
jgi:hypothetical protein